MVRKSGQPLSPCVEIDGVMLADISGEEVENYLLANDLVKPSDTPAGVPTNAALLGRGPTPKWPPKTIRFFLTPEPAAHKFLGRSSVNWNRPFFAPAQINSTHQ